MLTILIGRSAARTDSRTAWVSRTGPRKLTAARVSHSASSFAMKGSTRSKPAALTRTSGTPCAVTTSSRRARIAALSARSTSWAWARPSPIVATVSASPSPLRSTATTCAPARASPTATARPIPDAAPVTRASLFSRSTPASVASPLCGANATTTRILQGAPTHPRPDDGPHRPGGTTVGFEDYEHLRLEHRDNGVLLITIDRQEKYNAADEQTHTELARVWKDVSADPRTRVAVITGAGKAFSAGGDLAMVERMAGNYDAVTHMLTEMSDLVYNIINCDKPIVSAINGVAVGAGTVAALLADIAIAAEDARIGDGHVKLGVAAGDHAAIIWPLLAGMAKARYYLLTGEMITGAEAERIGMVAKALPRDQVLDEALRVADVLATGAQQAIRLTKRSLNNWLRQAGPTFDQSAAYEMLTFMGPDVVEGVAALREKRAPSFPSAGPPA